MRRLVLVPLLAFLAAPSAGLTEEVTRTIGRLNVAIDTSAARQGGLLLVRLRTRRALGGVVNAILDGRRCPFFWTHRGLRALVPIPADFPSGQASLGIEVRGSTTQRFLTPVTIAVGGYPAREGVVPAAKRDLLSSPSALHDGRVIQLKLRTMSGDQRWSGPFRAPLDVPPVPSFGSRHVFGDAPQAEEKTDAVFGEYHRGLDYRVPVGTSVVAPAAGTVLQAGPLTLSGETVMIDHGQGVISVFYHLSETRVREGDWVEAGAAVGLSGESGIADEPVLHWGLYVDGVAVDPRVALSWTD